MNIWIELLKIILPALLVAGAMFLLAKQFFNSEEKKRQSELRKSISQQTTPLKIQAYERLTIFLERLNPNTLVPRVNKHNINNKQLYLSLISSIKQEFEHNLSQQLFISEGAWELVKTAKEETVKIINISYSKTQPDNSSNELSLTIINIASAIDKKLPHEIALEYLKKEASQIL